MTQSGVWHY